VGSRLFAGFPEIMARTRRSMSAVLDLPETESIRFAMTAYDNVISGASVLLLGAAVGGCGAHASSPAVVQFHSPAGWSVPPISAGTTIPSGRRLYFTSGIPPAGAARVSEQAGANPLGDTRAQARAVLRSIEGLLAEQHLGLKDVCYLRVYVAPDRHTGAGPDYPGWFAAYGEFFDNAANPVKVARSTLGVQSLINPDWLIEIEAVAVYPAESSSAEGM